MEVIINGISLTIDIDENELVSICRDGQLRGAVSVFNEPQVELPPIREVFEPNIVELPDDYTEGDNGDILDENGNSIFGKNTNSD